METHAKKSLLIIDDNVRLLTSYKTFFTQAGFSVYTADDGVKGVNQALEHIPSVILLDLMLPEKDGLTVMEELKDNEKTSHIPIVVLTALVDQAKKAESMDGGAVDYIEKVELEPQDLLEKINRVIAQSQEHDAT